jgi:hypothetical protein
MPDWYANTPEPAAGKERLNAYYLALGCFTHRFAWVEEAVHTVLSHYAKLPPAAARALLSGVRVDETKNRLSRLHEVGLISDADWMDVEPIFQQLGIINNRRNEIFHHGASFIAEGAGVVTNATMALTEERITKFDISADIIDDMTADLKKIFSTYTLSTWGNHRNILSWRRFCANHGDINRSQRRRRNLINLRVRRAPSRQLVHPRRNHLRRD